MEMLGFIVNGEGTPTMGVGNFQTLSKQIIILLLGFHGSMQERNPCINEERNPVYMYQLGERNSVQARPLSGKHTSA